MRFPIVIFIMLLICGCRASHPPTATTLAKPAQIRNGGAFFDGGTVALQFISAGGDIVEVYLPPDSPSFENVVGQPFYLGGHPEWGRRVLVGSNEEKAIVASLERFHGDDKTSERVREFLRAARIEDYLACRPALLNRRKELHHAMLGAARRAATQPSAWETDDDNERQRREQAARDLELERARLAGRWEELNSVIATLAAK